MGNTFPHSLEQKSNREGKERKKKKNFSEIKDGRDNHRSFTTKESEASKIK